MNHRINRIYFREVQQFRQWWMWAIMLVPFLLFAYGFFVQIILGRPWGSRPASDLEVIGITTVLALIMVWVHQMKLITEVRDDGLHVHFFLLWRRRIIPYPNIRSVEVRTYNPVGEYGGWGIRWGGTRGWAYNVSGNRGVQFELAEGRDLLIGSQRPEQLADAIKKMMNADIIAVCD